MYTLRWLGIAAFSRALAGSFVHGYPVRVEYWLAFSFLCLLVYACLEDNKPKVDEPKGYLAPHSND